MKNNKKYLWVSFLIILLVGVISTIVVLRIQDKKESNYKLVELTGEDFKAKINNKDRFIMIIYKTGCSHCESFMPVFEEVMGEYKLSAYKINTADLSTTDLGYLQSFITVEGTPTTIFFANGEETSSLNRMIGDVAKEKIISRLKTMGYIE